MYVPGEVPRYAHFITSGVTLTQEFLAEMKGTQRTAVTVALGVLQRKGPIEYSRGRIHLIDRIRLEEAACECYAIVRDLPINLYQERAGGA